MLTPYNSQPEPAPQQPFMAEDPQVEQEAAEAIVPAASPEEGGICHECAFLQGAECGAFSGPLQVNPDMIADCARFRPKLGEMGGELGMGGMGGMGGMMPPGGL